jgi:hypothetical protein
MDSSCILHDNACVGCKWFYQYEEPDFDVCANYCCHPESDKEMRDNAKVYGGWGCSKYTKEKDE